MAKSVYHGIESISYLIPTARKTKENSKPRAFKKGD